MPVDVFARAESVALLRAHLPTLPDRDADRLADALGDLPLALAQAAGLLAETGMPVAEYLGLLDEAPAEVLDEGAPISYPRSLAKSLRVAVAQLAGTDPAAAQLLTLCAFLAPDPIPTGWFPAADPAVLPRTAGRHDRERRWPTGARWARWAATGWSNSATTTSPCTGSPNACCAPTTPPPTTPRATVGRVLAGLTPGRPDDPRTWPAWADLLPHLRALDLAATDDEKLAWQACEAAGYLLLAGRARASHDMIAPLYRAWRDRLGPDRPADAVGGELPRPGPRCARTAPRRRRAGTRTPRPLRRHLRRRPPRHPHRGQQPRLRPGRAG